ncbi:MAG: hypothetical protein V1743_06115 [Nanoarchaeota archaeon]
MEKVNPVLFDAVVLLLGKDIREKKELRTLDADFIEGRIQSFLKKNPNIRRSLMVKALGDAAKIKKTREYRLVLKSVRKELREVYGVFIMQGYAEKKASDSDEKILRAHRSSAERLPAYRELYGQIFLPHAPAWKGKRVRVIDLGCGMNPASCKLLAGVLKQRITYAAYDVSSQDMAFLNSYFRSRGIRGAAIRIDLAREEDFPMIDLHKAKDEFLACFLFKLVDTLETVNRHISKKLILHLAKHADLLAVTFPTKTIGGRKRIAEEKRWWLEGFLRAHDLPFQTSIVGEELLYVIRC